MGRTKNEESPAINRPYMAAKYLVVRKDGDDDETSSSAIALIGERNRRFGVLETQSR